MRRRQCGGTNLLLGKPNLRGAKNAEAILRTYHRSRLRPPSPSLSHPPPFNPFHRRAKRRMEGREKVLPHISLYILCLTYQYSRCPLIPLVPLGHSLFLSSSPSCLRHENGWPVHLGTTAGLLKNALAPSAKPSSLSPPPVARTSLRGKCFRP